MWLPLGALLGFTTQLPLISPPPHFIIQFRLKSGSDRFTPRDLIQLSRPSAGTANPSGDLVLIHVSEYSFADKKNHKSIFIAPLEFATQHVEVPLPHGGEAFWLDERTVGHVVADEESKTASLFAISIELTTETLNFPTASPSSFRYAAKAGVLVFTDNVHEDGDLTKVPENDKEWHERGHTALIYDDAYERHWDTWTGPKRPSLFTVKLSKDAENKWDFGDQFFNVLHGTGHHSPVEPFGGVGDYDVSGDYIVYTTKDPDLPEAWHTKQNVYLIGFTGSQKPRELTSGKQGATRNPVFNAQGDKVAWTELEEDGYESDRAKVVIYDLKKDIRFTLTQSWDRSAEELAFSQDSSFLYLTAGDHARNKLFILPLPDTPDESSTHPPLLPKYTTPQPLTHSGAVTAVQLLPDNRLIFSRSSLRGPNDVFIIRGLHKLEADLAKTQGGFKWEGTPEQITRFTEKALIGKTLRSPEDFYFEGAEGKRVHGFVVKPYGWKEGDKKKWPGLLLIHGGPQGVWDDRWSTRWNPNVFAHQGYFVVAINPTGSTTFGQDFTDAIAKDWGGKPFVDLQKGWNYALDKFPEIDRERTVAGGASWGGYAINWIQGHPEYGFNFKALLCHDGVFDATYNGYSTDELFFFNHEWGGRPWEREAKEILEKYNPINYVHKWSTPQLVIHGSKDYRLPETDGIGAFHALKQQGVPTRLVIFPDENHWVLKHGNSLKWHYEAFRWFDSFVGEDEANAEVVELKN
ncbi:alpha/beta-hydrolase [Multifurca ochricompacta]|uniref:Dipeptidyl-peptidase V n=1 Tax=Multifurca ochricompacta TaxID=376703 RepID=A0AAD4M7S6_9AGAM|nr:alpha/beta-hydrolase [Multifurca ochricompacta]